MTEIWFKKVKDNWGSIFLLVFEVGRPGPFLLLNEEDVSKLMEVWDS